RLRRGRHRPRRFDCYRLERPLAGWELHPLKTDAFSRRTLTPFPAPIIPLPQAYPGAMAPFPPGAEKGSVPLRACCLNQTQVLYTTPRQGQFGTHSHAPLAVEGDPAECCRCSLSTFPSPTL